MSKSLKRSRSGAPRSPLFRALGAAEPPAEVMIQGAPHRRLSVFKHDSWAATALYDGPAGKVVCKFNRRQSILGVPMSGLGRWLAEHEMNVLRCLQDQANVPRCFDAVLHAGRRLENVSAHSFVEGHPLAFCERVPERFFDRLAGLLQTMHDRDMAYVDLHKRENILVGADGEPYLFDFQISFSLPKRLHGTASGLGAVLRFLQDADWYHLEKHRQMCRTGNTRSLPTPPWYIRGHRLIGQPFRFVRRRLLVALGMRTGKGRVDSEHFPEDAVRQDVNAHPKAA